MELVTSSCSCQLALGKWQCLDYSRLEVAVRPLSAFLGQLGQLTWLAAKQHMLLLAHDLAMPLSAT
jgi:hypothetical protein